MRLDDEVPEGFEFRAATADDAQAIAELINEVTLAEIGMSWTTAEETRDEPTSPGRDSALADALLLGQDGEVVGFLQFEKWPSRSRSTCSRSCARTCGAEG